MSEPQRVGERDLSKTVIARQLAIELRALAANTADVSDHAGLTESVVDSVRMHFQKTQVSKRLGAAMHNGRGDQRYWDDHARLTMQLMTEICRRWGGNAALYGRVGLLHDVDYMAFPHDVVGKGPRHPVPLVRELMICRVHPIVGLAILEHAPYVGFDRRPSSRLSAALSAAEDLATLAALNPPFLGTDQLSDEARDLVTTVTPQVRINRTSKVRVENDIDRFVNSPLALIINREPFEFPNC